MAVVNGNDIGLYVSASGSFQLIGCLTSTGFESENTLIDVTCKDNGGASSSIQGGNNANIPFSGLFNPSSSYGLSALVSIHKNKTEVYIKMGDNTNLTVFASAILPTLSWTGELNAGTVFTGSFKVQGAWTYSTT